MSSQHSLFALGFSHHRKVRKLSDAAFRLWVTAIDHAKQDRCGGLVTADDIDCYPRAPRDADRARAIAELVGLGLWDEMGPGRWKIHDFEEWQASSPVAESLPPGGRLTPQQLGGLARAKSQRAPSGKFSAGPAADQLAGPAEHQQTDQLAGPAGSRRSPPHPPSDQRDPEFTGNERRIGSGSSEPPTTMSLSLAEPAGTSRQSSRRSQLAASWLPAAEHIERAAREGLDVAAEAEKFRLHAKATGRLMVNWNAAFTTWIINAKRYAQTSGRARGGPVQPSIAGGPDVRSMFTSEPMT